MSYWVSVAFNGLSFGVLLFLLGAGLSLTLGTMRVVNLTHGSFYLLGAYLALETYQRTGSFYAAVLVAPLIVAVQGLIVYVLLRPLKGDELRQALLTFGLAFITADLCLARWGGLPLVLDRPGLLSGTWDLGLVSYPSYRIVLLALGSVMALVLWLVIDHSTSGARLRAVIDDREMAEGVGIRSYWLAGGTFVAGALLAGLGGAVGAALIGAYPGVDIEILLFALVVVILGGAGSVFGALLGSVIIGLVNSFGNALVPEVSLFGIFLAMFVVLALKPTSLFGRR